MPCLPTQELRPHPRARPIRAALAIVALLLSGCGDSLEVDLPPADPDLPPTEGLAFFATAGVDAFLELNARIGSHSGYVAMFARDGQVVHATTAGHADIEAGVPMQLDTRFRIASMTKAVTAVAAMQLLEAGRLSLDDPVARYIPAAASLRVATSIVAGSDGSVPTESLARPLTVRDLLTFTSGVGDADDDSDLGKLWADNDIYAGEGPLADRVDRIFGAPLFEQPGLRWRYGWSADVLARVIEVAAGEPFGLYVKTNILDPLGMHATGFLPPEGQREGMATMYTQDADQNLVRVDSAESDAAEWTPGGSGLVSTAGDYMRFALMLWNGGTYDGVKILSQETVALMTKPHVPSGVLVDQDIEGLGWGLGLAVVVDSDKTPTIDRDGDFWWSGYYGTTFFVSPETGLVGLVMTQNQPSSFSDLPYAVYLAQGFAYFGL